MTRLRPKSIWKIVRLAAVSATVFSTLFLTILYVKRNTLVVIAHFGGTSVYEERSYEILNPFRDKLDEFKAELFLTELQKHCGLTLAAIPDDPEHISYTCQGEELHPLINWRLRARQQESSYVTLLRYEVTRFKSRDSTRKIDDPFWIRVKKENDEWRVLSYEAWY